MTILKRALIAIVDWFAGVALLLLWLLGAY